MLHTFTHKNKKSRRFGRGGNRGKTSGRGGKGQTARAGHSIKPAIFDYIQSLPKLRGHGKNRARSYDESKIIAQGVSLAKLDAHFENGAKITPALLLKKGLIRRQGGKIVSAKILGTGEVKKKFTVCNCSYTESAKVAIEKAGGRVTI